MKKDSVAAVVNFCTNEGRFLSACLQQALLFSSQVVVPVASHFFDGTEERRDLLEEIYAAFPECLFIEYPFVPDQIPQSVFKTVRPAAFWHCLSRLIGTSCLDPRVETVFFLDADEVADGIRVAEWLNHDDDRSHLVLKFANYWYFREPIYRANSFEDSIVLIQRKALTPNLLLRDEERDALYEIVAGSKKRNVMGLDGAPLFHHFSWVRTKEEMLKKVKSWGHRNDCDWEQLVHMEFSRPFQGVDFVHRYSFREVPAPFSISLAAPSFHARGLKNVLRLSAADVRRYAMKKNSLFSRFLS